MRNVTRREAEQALLAQTSSPLVLSDSDTFVELRREMDKIEGLIRRTAERFGVGDPGAATAAELVLEMRAAVDAYREAHSDE